MQFQTAFVDSCLHINQFAVLPSTESPLAIMTQSCIDIHTRHFNTHFHTTPRAAPRLNTLAFQSKEKRKITSALSL